MQARPARVGGERAVEEVLRGRGVGVVALLVVEHDREQPAERPRPIAPQVPTLEVETGIPVGVARVREIGRQRPLGPRPQDLALLRAELDAVGLRLAQVAQRVQDDARVLVGLDVLRRVEPGQRVAVKAPARAQVRDRPRAADPFRARAPAVELLLELRRPALRVVGGDGRPHIQLQVPVDLVQAHVRIAVEHALRRALDAVGDQPGGVRAEPERVTGEPRARERLGHLRVDRDVLPAPAVDLPHPARGVDLRGRARVRRARALSRRRVLERRSLNEPLGDPPRARVIARRPAGVADLGRDRVGGEHRARRPDVGAVVAGRPRHSPARPPPSPSPRTPSSQRWTSRMAGRSGGAWAAAGGMRTASGSEPARPTATVVRPVSARNSRRVRSTRRAYSAVVTRVNTNPARQVGAPANPTDSPRRS